MATKWKTVDVVCPYFKRFVGNSIECESCAKGFNAKLIRYGESQMLSYTNKYCNSYNYKNCPNAAVLEREEEIHGNT